MRYALESFQPLYAASPPFQRFLDELVLLQQALGAARDIEVALELAPEAARCPALLAVLREDYEAREGPPRRGAPRAAALLASFCGRV